MGAFELHDTEQVLMEEQEASCATPKKVKEECLITLKVYDSCRNQVCLTPMELGPCRLAEPIDHSEYRCEEGDFVRPPSHAASITIDRLEIKKIMIIDKQPSPFRHGYWDVEIKYVFGYRLTFREADGCVIFSIRANSVYNMKVSLFGSVGSDLVVGTDLLKAFTDSATFEAEPFIWVEAKAVPLSAKIHDFSHHREPRNHDHPGEVLVTLGLFSVIKLFRLVTLNVDSSGFNIPDECSGEICNDVTPCGYFEDLDFPMDIFSPPQRTEFLAGISENIPAKKKG